jgi:hypothetical protein
VKASLKTTADDGQPVRLTVRAWAREFHVPHMTLFRALKKHGEEPDQWGRYTTAQVVRANWGERHEGRVGLLKLKTESIKEKNAEKRAGLIPVGDVSVHKRIVFGAIRDELNSWKELDAKDKSNLLHHLPL